jgi:hypothetical protein
MYKFVLSILIGSAAFGQNPERTFQLKNTSGTGMQELATCLRTVFNIQQLSVDTPANSLTLSGTADQLATADWLIPQLDLPAASRQSPATEIYRMQNGDSALVYGLVNAATPRDLQEILTNLRTILDVQKIWQISAPGLLVLRVKPADLPTVESLIAALDKTSSSGAGAELKLPDGTDDVVHVYYLAPRTDVNWLLRAVHQLGVRRAYVRSNLPSITARGTADQIAMLSRFLATETAAR